MATKLAEQKQFRSVGTLFIAEQSAGHALSMELLATNGLRPLTYQEALSRSLELMKELKGKRFWLAGQGIHGEDEVCIFNAQSELVKSTGKESLDKRIRVWSSDQPLSLTVLSDADTAYYGARFTLSGNWPLYVAQVVVGVVDEEPILGKGREALERLRRASPK